MHPTHTVVSLHVDGQQNNNAREGENGEKENDVLLKQQVLIGIRTFPLSNLLQL